MATTEQTNIQEVEEYEPFDYNKAIEDYKSGQKPILDAIMANYKKPVPVVDPDQEKKAKFGAALTDTFGSLAEMFAHGQGALVGKRETPSSTQTTNARLQALKDKYDNDMLQYGATKSNAELQDLNMYLSNARDAAGKKREYRLYKAKAAQEEADRKLKEQLAKEAAGQKDKEFNENKRQFDKKNTLDWYNATKDKKEEKKTVRIYLNNNPENFPIEDVEKIIGIAIRRGTAGKVTQTVSGRNGRPITQSVPITATTKLTPEQKMQIFEQVYPLYVKEKTADNRFVIEEVEPKFWKKPKPAGIKKPSGTPAAANRNNDPLGIL